MPDITMCQNDACPIKETCWRSTAVPTPERQTYANFQFSVDDQGQITCEYHWKNQGKK